jgi:hypothetical protein
MKKIMTTAGTAPATCESSFSQYWASIQETATHVSAKVVETKNLLLTGR